MNVTFACPSCEQAARVEVDETSEALVCPHCAAAIQIASQTYENGRLGRCMACPSKDLFVRKDFPQRLGVGIVGLGILASCVAWAYTYVVLTFAILLATALVDVLLYLVVGDALMCYRCHAQYRNLQNMGPHGVFDLETHERHRQLTARMAGQK